MFRIFFYNICRMCQFETILTFKITSALVAVNGWRLPISLKSVNSTALHFTCRIDSRGLFRCSKRLGYCLVLPTQQLIYLILACWLLAVNWTWQRLLFLEVNRPSIIDHRMIWHSVNTFDATDWCLMNRSTTIIVIYWK